MPEENNRGSLLSMISSTARSDFEQALRKGFWRSFFSWFNGKENRLLPFDEVRRLLPYQSQHYLGMRQIPLRQVIGSVGRYQDFDRAFLPRRSGLSPRWVSIDMAHLQDVILPPIEVYKIGDAYFVKDGNHRVSVARDRGQEEIDAYVIEIDTPVKIDENTNIDDLIRKIEQNEFETRTLLNEVRPEAAIELTLPGAYTKLIEHIETHRWFMGENLNRAVTIQEATRSWYDEVYMPLILVIREQGTIKEFPGRTEADLYLWIIEHLWYLREELNRDVSMEVAAAHFAEIYASSPLKFISNLFKQIGGAYSDSAEMTIAPIEKPPASEDDSGRSD